MTKSHPHVHHRPSTRLAEYDYTQAGAYFVTICTHERACLFENPAFKTGAEQVWRHVAGSPRRQGDEFVVMANHIHGIIWITEADAVGARHTSLTGQYSHLQRNSAPGTTTRSGCASPLQRSAVKRPSVSSGSVGAIVGAFKSASARRINELRRTPGAPVWQRNYYEHIIRTEADLARIRQYIRDNPRLWAEDPDNPQNTR